MHRLFHIPLLTESGKMAETIDPISVLFVRELSEFAVDVRYPGGVSEPPEGEAERFVAEAEKILRRIEEKLNVETAPYLRAPTPLLPNTHTSSHIG